MGSVPPPTEPQTPAPLPDGTLCPDCGYDLRGSTSERCPECGFELAAIRSRESLLPWSHRAELGWFRAYWRTVWMVVRRPSQVCLEVARPVSYADSQRFRWVTFAHMWAAFVVIAVTFVVCSIAAGDTGDAYWWYAGGFVLWSGLWMALLPGLASYFFQSKRLAPAVEDRVLALSYYAWGPWAVLPALATPVATWLANVAFAPDEVQLLAAGMPSMLLDFVTVLTPCLLLGSLFVADRLLASFLRRLLHASWVMRVVRRILVWVTSITLGAVLLFIPLSVFYVLLIVYSLLQ